MVIRILANTPDFFIEQMRNVYPKTPGSSCHRRVSAAIHQRRNPNDIIWFYGTQPGNNVTHSVLTDRHHKVIVGEAEAYPGSFKGEQGFWSVRANDMLDFIAKRNAAEVL
jgi:hypothetical protein